MPTRKRGSFRSPISGGGAFRLAPRARDPHANHLETRLNQAKAASDAAVVAQKAAGLDEGFGITLQFEGSPNFDLKFESLNMERSGVELLGVRTLPNGQVQATVFVPDGKLELFLKRVTAYRDEETKPNIVGKTRPKNEDLIASISDIHVAALEALWTDTAPFPGLDAMATWEVWLRRSDDIDHLARVRELAPGFELTIHPETISFIDRSIILVHGRGRDLARSNELLGSIAELRLAKTTADLFTTMSRVEQTEWVDDVVKRLRLPPADAPYVCLFDTGVNHSHPLLAPVAAVADLHTYNPAWGVDDRHGHGTPMAGLAIHGDLNDVLSGNQPLPLTHRLESVKLFNSDDQHAPHLFGAVTVESVNRVEVTADRKRVFCMAVTATDDRDRGRPSSWSAALDELTSGRTDGVRRLVVLSAGNTNPSERKRYPVSNMTDGVHDPGQSWNALVVGGYTEKALVDQTKYPGWQALARAGDLAPASCTGVTWVKSRWPIKPDVVLEAGNMAVNPAHAEPDYIDDRLQTLSTAHNFGSRKLLVPFGDTSGASALGARLAAKVWAKYPNLTPEAVRALIAHSASWTPAMSARFTSAAGEIDYEALVRCFGHGVPNERLLLSSLDNSLTLIAQGEITPFHKDGNDIKPREMKLHTLPWPSEVLAELQSTPVTLRVTLSYFIEPNPGARGWSMKYGYQSHGLRFAVKRAPESVQAFQKRINKAEREDHYDADHLGETGEWRFKGNTSLPTLGSLRSNTWSGIAIDLAARDHITVVPTYGWWNKRPNLEGYVKSSHYALIATITTPDTDIYTSVATKIGVPVVIEV